MKNHQFMFRVLFTLFMLSWAIAVTIPSSAAELVVTRYFSGLWDQPKQESQGIMLQIIDQEEDGKKRAVAYWFTYGDNLDTAWYVGIGLVEGDQVILTLYTAEGVSFMEDDLPGDASVFEVGALVLSFKNCNHGTASYETSEELLGSGEFEIKKLAGLYNSRCSGGISDDTPSNAKPLQLEVGLEPAREGISGKGKAKFWERVDRSDFHASAENVADGEYAIWICEEDDLEMVGTVTVADGEGQTQFRSPEAAGKDLLTFDPRNCRIELHDAEGAALTSGDDVLAEKGNSGGSNGGGVSELSVDLDNVSVVFPEVTGTAEYRIKNNSIEFDVEIKDLLPGLYPLYVDFFEVGQIEVIEDDGEMKGRLRFSDPPKEEREFLGFDPRGKLIEVMDGADPLLEVFFPES
jgi:hypothetical protein